MKLTYVMGLLILVGLGCKQDVKVVVLEMKLAESEAKIAELQAERDSLRQFKANGAPVLEQYNAWSMIYTFGESQDTIPLGTTYTNNIKLVIEDVSLKEDIKVEKVVVDTRLIVERLSVDSAGGFHFKPKESGTYILSGVHRIPDPKGSREYLTERKLTVR